jgi:hypothetical protein
MKRMSDQSMGASDAFLFERLDKEAMSFTPILTFLDC